MSPTLWLRSSNLRALGTSHRYVRSRTLKILAFVDSKAAKNFPLAADWENKSSPYPRYNIDAAFPEQFVGFRASLLTPALCRTRSRVAFNSRPRPENSWRQKTGGTHSISFSWYQVIRSILNFASSAPSQLSCCSSQGLLAAEAVSLPQWAVVLNACYAAYFKNPLRTDWIIQKSYSVPWELTYIGSNPQR